MAGTKRHRRAFVRPNDCTLLGYHLDWAEGAAILWRIRVYKKGNSHADRRARVGIGGVNEACDLWVGVG